MTATVEIDSTLTDRYQTTVPEPVRRALKLGKRDKIHYSILDNGSALISRAVPADAKDPVMETFLGFLARDMTLHPERIQSVDTRFAHRIKLLVGKVTVDIDAPLSADDE